MGYVVPILILVLFVFCVAKRIAVFDLFVLGGKSAVPLVVSVFPYLVGIFFMLELSVESGFIGVLEKLLSPIFSFFGIPAGVGKLVIFRPFSGSGSIAILKEVFEEFGVDSLEGRVGSAICGASETVFYLSAVYFSSSGIKKIGQAIAIALLCSFVGVIFCTIFCQVM